MKRNSKLEPPDRKRCQTDITVTPGARAEIVEGLESQGPLGAFMLGPQASARTYRCDKNPVVIATERRAGPDGQRGSMSLCESHRVKMIQQRGADFATFVPIRSRVMRNRRGQSVVRTETSKPSAGTQLRR